MIKNKVFNDIFHGYSQNSMEMVALDEEEETLNSWKKKKQKKKIDEGDKNKKEYDK